MKKITITQTYEITLPKEYEHETKEKLLNDLNSMYDIYGQRIINALHATEEYSHSVLKEIDDEDVYINGNKIRYSGSPIILDGQPLYEEN